MLKPIVLGVALSAFACLGAANAAIVDVTYTGKLADISDVAGDVAGSFVTVSYVFDTSKGEETSDGVGKTGGAFLADGSVSPALSATITIGTSASATTYSFDGSDLGTIVANSSTGGVTHQYHGVTSSVGDYVNSFVDVAPGAIPTSITTSFTYTLQAGDTGFSSFSLADGSSGDFVPESISVSSVPLPSSLPLFAVGLVGLGAAAAFGKRNRLSASR